MLGVGGKGIVPGRPRDTCGVGWTRLECSDDFVPFLRQRLPLGVEDESTVEMYYNASLTPWLNVSPSLQITDPGLDNALNERGQLEELDTALVFFLRTFIRF
jgi:porin